MKYLMLIAIMMLSGCANVSGYLKSAGEASQEASMTTLKTTIFYLCDRARIGDLYRIYKDEKQVVQHIKDCKRVSDSQKIELDIVQ